MIAHPLLPMEILGCLAPILAPVHGMGAIRHRASLLWNLEPGAQGDRDAIWLGGQFPHHAEEALDEARQLVYQRIGTSPLPLIGEPPFGSQALWGSGRPPQLAATFDWLSHRYLRWSGSQMVIRTGRMEEIHQLALIFPVTHLVHSTCAQALVRGDVDEGRLWDWRNRLVHLPSANSALSALAERGLTEGHLHLWGTTSAEERWADHLLGRRPGALHGRREDVVTRLTAVFGGQLLRLLVLGLLAFRRHQERPAQALCGPATRQEAAFPGLLRLESLVARIDQACSSVDKEEVWWTSDEVARELRDIVDNLLGTDRGRRGWLGLEGIEMAEFLLAPERLVLTRRHEVPLLLRAGRRSDAWPQAYSPTPAQARRGAVSWLHLEVHRLLLELPTGRRCLWGGAHRQAPREAEPPGFLHALDQFIERVFLRYLVLQTYHHQLGTHGGRRMGLRRFRTYFSSPARRSTSGDERKEILTVLRQMEDDPCLAAVEGRVSPSLRGAATIRPWLLGLEELRRQQCQALGGRPPREPFHFGLIVHFLKRKEKPPARGSKPELWPQNLPRFAENRQRVRREALDLYRFLSAPDPQAPFIVGIDAADQELHAPPEVFAPAFEFLRKYPINLRGGSLLHWSVIQERSLVQLLEGRFLGLTYHIGEDFRHLLSGLRALHEALEFLSFRPGDRLGHAIALGIEPGQWTELLAGQTLVTRQEWLDDLIWVWHLLGPGHDLLGELKVEDEIRKHAAILYEHEQQGKAEEAPPSPLDLHHAWRLRRLDPLCLSKPDLMAKADGNWRKSVFKEKLAAGVEETRWWHVQKETFEALEPEQMRHKAFHLHWLYLYDPKVRKEGSWILPLEITPEWLEVCRQAQAKLRRLVHDRRVVVEVNPSSNCTVGPITRLRDHHIFRLTRSEGGPPLTVTVNTDDPGVFQTSLAHEFFLLGEELLRQGAPEREALQWLEELRKNGAECSFLKRLARAEPAAMKAVLEDVRRLYGSCSETRDRWINPGDVGPRP